MADAEYEVMSKFVRADRRFRIFLYVVVVLCFFAFAFILYEVHMSNEKTQEEITSKIDSSLKETRTQNEETRQYVTCLLLVPIQERTPELQQKCFDGVDKPGGLDRKDFQSTDVGAASNEVQPSAAPSSNVSGGSSYSNGMSEQSPIQRDISQGDDSVVENERQLSGQLEQSQSNFIDQLLNPDLMSIKNLLGGN